MAHTERIMITLSHLRISVSRFFKIASKSRTCLDVSDEVAAR